jgi:hypothetical protein
MNCKLKNPFERGGAGFTVPSEHQSLNAWIEEERLRQDLADGNFDPVAA